MKVYIDFDRTLFDCDSFLVDLYSIIQKYKIPKKIFKDSQIQCKKIGFNPYIILKKVEKEFSFNHEIYNDIDKLLNNTSKYLYDDTISFLKYLKSSGYEIIILTKGNSDYQKRKITNSNISNYYDDIIITMNHKGNLNIDYVNGTFIDDSPMEIKSILRKKPKMVIRMTRVNSKYSDVKMDIKIKVVKTLDEIILDKLL